jgi:pantothenate synthetase
MSEKPNTTEEKKLKVITKAELAKHGEKDDTKWIVVEVLIPPLNFRVELLM